MGFAIPFRDGQHRLPISSCGAAAKVARTSSSMNLTLFCSCNELKSRRHQRCPQWLRSRERHLLGKRRELLGLIGQYRKLLLCMLSRKLDELDGDFTPEILWAKSKVALVLA